MIRAAPITIVVTARNRSELDPRALAEVIDHWWDEDGVADMALHRMLDEPGGTAIDTMMTWGGDGRTASVSIRLAVAAKVPNDWTQADLERRLDNWFDVDPDAKNALNRKLGEVTNVDADVTLERNVRP